jgi:HSP20 family molecular chaperone IbpA
MRRIRSINLMWGQAWEMLQRGDRLQRELYRLAQVGRIPAWEPPVDIFESESELLLRIAVPDVRPEDLQIHLEECVIRLTGQRRLPKEAAGRDIRQLEIPYGRLERELRLPAGHFRLASSAYNNGCLEISLQRISGHG